MANTENVRKTLELLKFDPTIQFDMGCIMSTDDRIQSRKYDCGTSGCIAGYAFIAAKGRVWNETECQGSVEEEAAKFLGLDEEEAHNLFYPYVEVISYTDIEKSSAIKVVEHLIDTDTVDWSVSGIPTWKDGSYEL